MHFPNAFDMATPRRLALGLMAAGGAFLFAALHLIGAGISGGNKEYAAKISASVWPLAQSMLFGLMALISTELAAHPSTPRRGHPHSKPNYLQTAFALIAAAGLGYFLYGAWLLLENATVK